MRSATIVREKKDHKRIHVRISGKDEPQDGGDHVELIEVLHSKDGETMEQFRERVERFIRECIP